MTLDEGDLFVVVRGRPSINAVGFGFNSTPFQSYDRSYDDYIFKIIKTVLDVVAVVEVVYARRSLSPYTADETGTRRLMNLRDMEIMTVDAEFVAALKPPEKPKDTADPAENKTDKPDWLKRLEKLGWGESPVAAAMRLAYQDKVAKTRFDAEQYQINLLKKLEEASKLTDNKRHENRDSDESLP